MNFTWFASAYDTDDVVYRLAVLVQLTGALVLAAGVPRAFDEQDFGVVTLGYVAMRLATVAQWLRAARSDPARRACAHRYALGVGACQTGWVARLFLPASWALPAFVGLAIAELLVPVWAERAGATTWHPGHIAERYGLFTIIVLGESILAASTAIQSAMQAGDLTADLTAIIGDQAREPSAGGRNARAFSAGRSLVTTLRRMAKGRVAAAWLGAVCVLAPGSLLAQHPEIPSAVGYRKGALADLRRLTDLAPLARDAAFRLHMLRAEKGEGIVARVESFSTSASFAEVKVDLETQLGRELRATLEDRPDADVARFAREAGEAGIAELGPAVLGTLSPAELRREVAAAFRPENVPPSRVARGEIVGENGMRTRVEVQQPYFDLGLLGWMPVTRIRFVRFVEGGAGANSTEPREPGASPPSPPPPSAPRPESNP